MGTTSTRHWGMSLSAWTQALNGVARSYLLPWKADGRQDPPAPVARPDDPAASLSARSEAEHAQAGLLQATLAGLERIARTNTELLHRDTLKFCAMADLIRELGLLARMQSARGDLVLVTLNERIRLEPLPTSVRTIVLAVTGTGITSLRTPLAHFVIVDMLCQASARWPASERPTITLNVQNGQVKYSCALRSLTSDEQQRLGLFLSNLDLALTPFKRDLRSTPSAAPGGPHELTILIAA